LSGGVPAWLSVWSKETTVCRYNWHSVGSLGWPLSMLKYKHIFEIKYAEANLSNKTAMV